MTFTIYDSLPCGKESAISAAELAKIHGIKDTRALRHEITAERLNGAYIAGSERGYYRPISLAEFQECWQWFHTRAISSFRISKLFRDAIRDQFEGQINIFDLQGDEQLERFFMDEGNSD
jgi:hypothetical protein